MIKRISRNIKELYEKQKFKQELRTMDSLWYFVGGNCFGLFPPSFYYTHTKEEINKITTEVIGRIYSLIDEL